MKKIQFILISGLLLGLPLPALADTTINTPTVTAVSFLTSVFGNITIAPTGSLTINTAFTDAITIDTAATSVITNANNDTPFAIFSGTGAAISATNINSTITIGANSTISGGGILGGIFVGSGGAGAVIENDGTILASTATGIFVLASTHSITNTGSISGQGQGILIFSGGDVVNGINNSGTIQSALGTGVVLSSGGHLSGGLTNSGTITGNGAAIALSNNVTNVLFTNNAPGIVNGDVILSPNVSSNLALQMNGGTINGTVFTPAGGAPRILNVAGGTIVGGIDLASLSTQPDVINQSGGIIGSIVGASGLNQTLNITGFISQDGSIVNLDNINVQSNGTFEVTNPVVNAQTVTVDGTLFLVPFPASNPNLTTASYNQSNSGVLEVALQDKNNFGHMDITGPGVTNINGDILKVVLTGGVIRNLDTFDIIHETGTGTISGLFNLIQPTSAWLHFIQNNTSKDVILEAIRTPFIEGVCEDEIARGPANSIDAILRDNKPLSPTFESFIMALDNLDAEGVEAVLRTTAPQFDGGLVDLSQRMQESVFRGLGRTFDKNRCLQNSNHSKPGYVSGDVTWGRLGHDHRQAQWLKVFGTKARQKENCLSQGYDFSDTGVILGYDGHYSDRLVLGTALSYAAGDVMTRDPSHDRQAAQSYQITAYSTYDCSGLTYLDMMAGVAYNYYNSTRHILAEDFFAKSTAKFTALNYGINLESGYRIAFKNCEFIPLARLYYSRLQINHYTECGADGLSLSICNEPVQEGVTGIGFKLNSAWRYRNISYVPELRFNILYDWMNYQQTMRSEFLEGGPAFITHAYRHQPCTHNLGVSLNTFFCKNMILALNYDVDLRNAYYADNLSVKFSYEW